jgi:hypothetical protein
MGYTTQFKGCLNLSRQLTEAELTYITKFSAVRHMYRDNDRLMEEHKGQHGIVGVPNETYGIDGEFYVGGGQHDYTDKSVINHNGPPKTQPGLWCQWIIKDNKLQWDGGEKFYSYTEWLQYLIDNFFEKWNVKLNGQLSYKGKDTGSITVVNNKVTLSYPTKQ